MSSPRITRRALAAASIAAGLSAVLPFNAQAQTAVAPKVLRLVVPFPAGGTADVLPRVLAEKMRDAYPAGIVVENRTGAGGNIGGEFVARAEPDGSTLLVSPPGPIAINHHLYKSMPFDPTKWVPVTVVATVPNVLGVSNRLPVANLAEFIAYLKANPDKVTYASQGNGSTSHLTANLFMQLTGTRMVHIPYRGTAPALTDLVGGQVDVFFDNIASSAQYHQGKRIKVLAVADSRRSKALPDVPSFAELKLPDMQAVTFFGVVAPAGTPNAVAQQIQKHFAEAMALPDVREKFAAQGAEPGGQTPQQTAAFIKAESDKWARVIKTANVTLE
ncbi:MULTISPECIES: tripartite tricarboxylate transporter substrate binding protein [unclassified Hydrogenophaga]|uniref:Bug family tripartite tricarboxylate transporter substrate binding protein n=1 Tax=unclassified Hydrogenophaga TaxID=2610897 RepID=UPI00087834A1|nr:MULTISPECIES: tripartite tricarboxylate transporter substrate binding protein [unclassified Hydrogenophaga]MBN9372345.1 tripartite tricarboxylate transporter substrate binding protein [Hydrogenophaga sp.]OJV40587.1 MAG: receptor [Hydrogenophaga sp. 70-12]